MPLPIKPTHTLENHDELFFVNSDRGLSDIQLQMLGEEPTRQASMKFSERAIELLDAIYKSEDELITAAANLSGMRTASIQEKYFRVPEHINNNDLLRLKTDGLVVGDGRLVKLTKQAEVALRDHWLKSGNKLKETRPKAKFDYATEHEKFANESFTRISETSKSVRTASKKSKFIKLSEDYGDHFDEDFHDDFRTPEILEDNNLNEEWHAQVMPEDEGDIYSISCPICDTRVDIISGQNECKTCGEIFGGQGETLRY